MSKGAGLGRGGSRLGGGGAISGALGPAKQAQAVISKLGGLMRGASIPFEKQFRQGAKGGQQRSSSLAYHTQKYAGAKTTAEKNRISAREKPIQIGIMQRRGRWYAGLEDGRHRLFGAKAAGATKIRAEVTISQRGKPDRVVVTMVKI